MQATKLLNLHTERFYFTLRASETKYDTELPDQRIHSQGDILEWLDRVVRPASAGIKFLLSIGKMMKEQLWSTGHNFKMFSTDEEHL
jgi:hypothetical protein